ncbi:retrovirus-related Pol polyprotein from type-1 retrotransposable element R2 [Trichonephila clavata]|uniref:Retrovirus-related Pol polyprotein from type-1 retrotransposable element R2 n=1 Tax=Trichonephila clavata TaxID=2740835 RepID=A0A8X6I927_TRICU|nr:retrovirus-related Pol polyprotein from type-1 retrotransposable element R2 [Trichonephila clavata]
MLSPGPHQFLMNMSNKFRKSFSQPSYSSTPRRHSRGSPVAHRTRRQISFARAVQIGLCKICHRVLPGTQSLWDHLNTSHSPSPRQQYCLDAFPKEFHIKDLLSKEYDWLTPFRKSSVSLITQGGTPSHGPDPVSTIQDPLGDAAEKGLLTPRSQPLTGVSGELAPSPTVSCIQDQLVCETLPTVPSKTGGLSSSWCAPVQVYSSPIVHRKCSELSQSLPLNLITIQHKSPIWPPVSPVQCLEAPAPVTEIHSEAPCVSPNAGLPVAEDSPSVSPGQPVIISSVTTICEIPPKTRSTPSPQSPDILDIVLAGDISLPDSPDVTSLREAWPGKLNGSPPHPAFPPPSFAQHSLVVHGEVAQQRVNSAPGASVVSTSGKQCVSTSSNVGTETPPLFRCPECGFIAKSKKGLFYHTKEAHKKPSPPLAVAGTTSIKSTTQLPLSISGKMIQISLPVADIIPCPFDQCRQTFATGNWDGVCDRIKNHFANAHGTGGCKLYQFCSLCRKGFFENPVEHSCLKGGYIIESAPPLPKRHTKLACSSSTAETVAPPVEDLIVERTVSVKQSFPSSPPVDGIDLHGDTLRYFFPTPQTMCCPVSGCSHSFTTKKWFTTNTSIKRHLTSFHRRPNLFVQYWCSSCRKRIVQPARHRCLKGASLVTRSSQGTWECEDCQFKASTKVGLDNHRKTHRREAAVLELPQLTVPETSSKKAKKKKARMAPLSSGDPGSARLAPPASPLAADPPCPDQNEDTAEGRADLAVPAVLEGFVEALDTLLEVDEISGSLPHLETLVDNLVVVVQEHFHLSRPPQNQNSTTANARRTSRTLKQCSAIIDGTDVWEHAKTDVIEQSQNPPTRPPVVEALAREFVLECLKSCENTAPGPDLISYKHWREVDPNCVVLTKLFNVCLKLADVPKRWKLSNTILIQKKNEPASITDWRPISLSDTAYKLFSKCLARKLSDWCETFEVMSPAQKGFSPFDGVIEHNFLLSEHLETARRDKCERFVAWLDIANAFGSIPHGEVQSDQESRAILAFADDIVLLAKSQVDLQALLDKACARLQDLKLEVNPHKCATLHLSGVTPVGARASKFSIGDIPLRHLEDSNAYTYLGKPVGFFLQKNFSDANEALRLADCIAKSHLAQWQKLDALKTFFFPSLSFAMRTDQLDKTAWSEVDKFVRSEVKNILSVPQNASNHYLSANKKRGGCSVPSAAEDSDFYLVDTAFKLLTSSDEEVALLALAQLTRTVRQRIKRPPTDGDLGSFLSGCMGAEFKRTTNRLANVWTNARKASVRQKITWSFAQSKPSLSIGDDVLTSVHRRKVLRTFHDLFQTKAASALKAQPSQGKAMDCVGLSPASTHFLTEGKFTRFADWRFIHKARLNLVPLNANKAWNDPQAKLCRRCGRWDETLPHVINHCPIHSAAWQKRHDAILNRIKAAVSFKGKILSVNKVVDKGLRPDIVAEVGDELFVLDVTIPFENRRPAFHHARLRKVEKYKNLIEFFRKLGHKKVSIVPIVVGSLGAWDPENDVFLRKVATKSYLNLLRKLCVSDCIRWSRDIYIQHLTGVKQYGQNTALLPEIDGVCENPGDHASDLGSPAASKSPSCSEPMSANCSPHTPPTVPLTQGEGTTN